MGELDAELERMREDARRKLEADAELERRIDALASAPAEVPPATREEAVTKPAARAAPEGTPLALSTKVILGTIGVLVALTVLNKILWPLLGIAILVGIVMAVANLVLYLNDDEPNGDQEQE